MPVCPLTPPSPLFVPVLPEYLFLIFCTKISTNQFNPRKTTIYRCSLSQKPYQSSCCIVWLRVLLYLYTWICQRASALSPDKTRLLCGANQKDLCRWWWWLNLWRRRGKINNSSLMHSVTRAVIHPDKLMTETEDGGREVSFITEHELKEYPLTYIIW